MSSNANAALNARERARRAVAEQAKKLDRIESTLTDYFELVEAFDKRRKEHDRKVATSVVAPLKKLALNDRDIAEATSLPLREVQRLAKLAKSGGRAEAADTVSTPPGGTADSLQPTDSTAGTADVPDVDATPAYTSVAPQ